MNYPFVPRSTAHLEPGQFWAIPIGDFRFACGRVIQIIDRRGRRDTRCFLAGLSSWCGASSPVVADLAGHSVLEQGVLHVKSIIESGGRILGHRPLELDEIRPFQFLDQSDGPTCMLLEGTKPLRPASTKDQQRRPVLETWGYNVPTILAKKHFSGSAA